MKPDLQQIWVYLAATPLLWLTLTLVAYQLALWVYRRSGGHPLANPVLMSIAVLVPVLQLTGTRYETYFDGAQFAHFLLGPATVALAIPLFAQWRRLRAMALPLLVSLAVGSVFSVVVALGLAKLLGASTATLMSLAPKSVTTPIGMGIAEKLGGIPSLTAVIVIVTGIVGAVFAAPLYRRLGIHDPAVQGFAIGLTAHGIGTARAFQMSEQTGAFSALAMGLNGLLTAVWVPWLVPLVLPLVLN
ncbi:MAG TPA: LrgB family protein [Rhodocyclaceae bacterium]